MARGEFEYSVANTPPTRLQRQFALGVVTVLLASFGAMAPFAATQLPRIDSFVPTVEAIIFVTDLTTAVLLFNLVAVLRAPDVLILANGYLFAGLIVVPHVLSYPGAFTSTGLFGPALQSAPWLFTFWHIGFSAAVLGYACLKERSHTASTAQISAVSAICRSVIAVVILVCVLTWAVTAEEPFLPRLLFSEVRYAPLANYVTVISLIMSLLALILLLIRQRSVLDLWVTVAIFATVVELATKAFLITDRFSLGFYASRLFSVAVSAIVLMTLLSEMVLLYAKLSSANRMLQRERESKLTNLEAAVAAIGHEMKQPLTAITTKGSAARRFLARQPPDISRVGTILGDIIDSTLHANDVLESIGALFRSGDQELRQIDLNGMIDEVLRLLHEDLELHGITVRTHLASGLPPIAGHRGQLQEVILNLIQNAVDAMGSVNGGARTLRVKTAPHDSETIAISVNDSGPGIDPRKIENIFDAFVTTKTAGKGLGLAIAQMIIDRHGGEISATRGSHGGARFQVLLPISRRPVEAINTRAVEAAH